MNLFVYGTLKFGEVNSFHLDGYEGLIAHVKGYALYGKNDPYPCAKKTENTGDIVYGEVYRNISLSTLCVIDELEGYPVLFDRELTTVYNSESELKILAYIYIYRGGVNEDDRIKHGFWS